MKKHLLLSILMISVAHVYGSEQNKAGDSAGSDDGMYACNNDLYVYKQNISKQDLVSFAAQNKPYYADFPGENYIPWQNYIPEDNK